MGGTGARAGQDVTPEGKIDRKDDNGWGPGEGQGEGQGRGGRGGEGEDVWHSFDDNDVARISSKDVKTRAAYILFYRKRPLGCVPSSSSS